MKEKTDSRKLFLMYMIPCLVVFANIVASKVTLIFGYPIAASIFIYPFAFLCVTLITHLYGTKDGMQSIILALFCQVIFYGLSILVCNLPTEEGALINANALRTILTPEVLDGLYYPSVKILIGSLVGFTLGEIFNVYLYDATVHYTNKYLSAFVSIFASLIVDALIFVSVSKLGTTADTSVFNATIIQIVARLIFSIILLGIFALVTHNESANEVKTPKIVIEKVAKTKAKTTTKKKTTTNKKK